MDRADAPPALERAPGARATRHLPQEGCAEDRLSARLSLHEEQHCQPVPQPARRAPYPYPNQGSGRARACRMRWHSFSSMRVSGSVALKLMPPVFFFLK